MDNKEKKELSHFHLAYMIIGLIAIGGFILISSGLFNSVNVNPNLISKNSDKNRSRVNSKTIIEINRLEEIIKKEPENYEALLHLAHLLNDNGFFDRAIEKYEKYLQTYKNESDIIIDLGVCYFELKKYDKSIEIIKSAIEIEPKHQIAHFNLGIVNLAKGNAAEAQDWWRKARDINPNTNIGKKAEELLKTKI